MELVNKVLRGYVDGELKDIAPSTMSDNVFLSSNNSETIDTGLITTYTHTRTGTVNEFTGTGSNGKALMTADVEEGDTFAVNGKPVSAYVGAEDATGSMAGSSWNGKWVSFVFDGTAINFKGGGGGKVTVSGLSAEKILSDTTVEISQGSKIIQSIKGIIPIYSTQSIEVPMYSQDKIELSPGYYEKTIIITPAYLAGTTLSDFSASGPFGSYKSLGQVTYSTATNGRAEFYGQQSTGGDGGYFAIGGICFLNKIGAGFKYADVYLSRYDSNGGVALLSSIPSAAFEVADATLPVHRLTIPSGGGYLYLGNHSHNIGNWGFAKHGVIVTKIILYPE